MGKVRDRMSKLDSQEYAALNIANNQQLNFTLGTSFEVTILKPKRGRHLAPKDNISNKYPYNKFAFLFTVNQDME